MANELTATELAAVAILGGLERNEDKVTTAVAIALAESGGNPTAHNDKPPDNSYGPWQINMIGDMGPDRRARWGLRSNDDLFVPVVNAKAMVDLSGNGGHWCPWSTYKRSCSKDHNGAYAGNLATARRGAKAALAMGAKELFDTGNAADAKAKAKGAPDVGGDGTIAGQVNLPGGGSVGGELPGAPAILGGLEAIGAFFNLLADGHLWVRILWIVGGLLLIILAVVLLGVDLSDVVPSDRANQAT